jgi:cytochrome c-type biogenesis protein CcmH
MSRINQKLLRITYYVILLIAIILIPTAIVYAQNPTPSDDDVNAIARQLYCPVCENTPLDVCPTEACRQWRALIRQMLSEGKSEAEIKQYFVENYGARVLGAPPATGLNWLVYIIPPVIILAGAFFLFRALKEWTKPVAASAGSGSAPNETSGDEAPKDDYIARLEDELKKRK